MRKYNLLGYTTIAIMTALLLAGTASAQYWFQSGARGSNDAGFNNGAGVSIQTIYQNATNGSLGFWVGESLPNGAFIQVGYEIANATGYYSSSCTNMTKDVFLDAGTPTWFWEYFASGSNNNTFCGGIGADGSAGKPGSFNNYSFRSNGNVWDAYFNNLQIGSVNLGASNSGPNPPSAFAEYADTNTNKYPLKNVTFKNMMFYIGNNSRLVPQGYSTVSYGKGSLNVLSNPYGVKEVGNFANYFVVGSSIPAYQSPVTLWKVGYSLSVVSGYGNLTKSNNYIAYSSVPLTSPQVINVSNGVREYFEGWVGKGANSYSGNSTTTSVTLYNNVTETAIWQTQYYLNATTQYGKLVGAGWYKANSTVVVSLNSNVITTGAGSRVLFGGWSNNATSNRTTIYLSGPKSLSASWGRQYYLNATAPYGNATGSGWYNANGFAAVTLTGTVVPINGTERLAFDGWNNGDKSSSINVFVSSPITLSAIFARQYLVRLVPENAQGQEISNVSYYNVSSQRYDSGNVFAFGNTVYNIEYFYYKGVSVTTNHQFSVDSPTILSFKAPIYDIAINTQSVFGTPVNASLNITFKNNTNVKVYSGGAGNQSFYNVPYGFVTGYAQFFGVRQSINLANGADSDLTFLTASLIAFIVGGIALIVVVAMVTAYYRRRRPLGAGR